jgi:chemotaxis protein MotA
MAAASEGPAAPAAAPKGGGGRLDILTVAGVGLGLTALLLADILTGGSPTALIDPPALVLVILGTVGATMVGFRQRDLVRVPAGLMRAVRPPNVDPEETIERLVKLAELARREGLLRLDRELDALEDDFMRHGVMLVVDGTDEALVRQILENQVDVRERGALVGARFFETAGGFAPTLGIIGTVLGLVSVLGNLTDVNKLAPSIAAAFIATLWGVSTANLFWLPMGNKLRYLAGRERDLREVIIEGVVAIGNGESPRAVERQLRVFVDPEDGSAKGRDKDKGRGRGAASSRGEAVEPGERAAAESGGGG